MTDQENKINNQNLPEQRDPVKLQEPDACPSPNPEKPKEDDPPHQQESDMLKKYKELIANNPKDIIHNCLSASFSNRSDISDFCFYHFEALFKELIETDGYERIIQRLIQDGRNQSSAPPLKRL